MIIHFDNVNPHSTSGPNSFAIRLAKSFFELGHNVVFDKSNADVSLIFIEPTTTKLASRVVQRLDGLWFKPSEFFHKNKAIHDCYQKSNAVIWQSEFDKTFVTKWWGQKPGTVINNGIRTEPVKKFTISALEQIRNSYKLVFCCSANWHPQKRLRDNVELFKHIRETIEPSSCLIVMGSNPDFIADKDIFYSGSQPHEVCLEVFSCANWMIHLAFLDHSPNVVVEALSQHTPVICSSEGGTKELVKDFGIVINETNPYDYGLLDYDNPPSINVRQLQSLPDKDTLGTHANIDIMHVAQRYIELFETL